MPTHIAMKTNLPRYEHTLPRIWMPTHRASKAHSRRYERTLAHASLASTPHFHKKLDSTASVPDYVVSSAISVVAFTFFLIWTTSVSLRRTVYFSFVSTLHGAKQFMLHFWGFWIFRSSSLFSSLRHYLAFFFFSKSINLCIFSSSSPSWNRR